MPNIVLIVGSARSGTTALTKILATATNAEIFTEQSPNLCVEARQLYEGKLADATGVLKTLKEPLVKQSHARGMIYGDKNPNYLLFIPHLPPTWDYKIVLVVRDGRDVVRSLMDWHTLKRAIYFTREDVLEGEEACDPPNPWDYSWPRPRPGEAYYDAWRKMPRFEKCVWYWSFFNQQLLHQFQTIRSDASFVVNMTGATTPKMEELFNFLDLEGFDHRVVEKYLGGRINSLLERTGEEDKFPNWRHWDEGMKKTFQTIARTTMEAWGFEHA